MNEEDGPNFSYAFGSANWHPALRPNDETPAVLTPVEKRPTFPAQQLMSYGAESPDPFLVTPGIMPALDFLAHPEVAISAQPSSDDDFFGQHGASQQSAPSSSLRHEIQHEMELDNIKEAAPSHDSTALQFVDGEPVARNADAVSDDEQGQDAKLGIEAEQEVVPPPDEHYEFQGEATVLEELQEDSATVPLISNTPTPAAIVTEEKELAWDEGPEQDTSFSLDAADQGESEPLTIPAEHHQVAHTQAAPAVKEENLDWGQADEEEFDIGASNSADIPAPTESEIHAVGEQHNDQLSQTSVAATDHNTTDEALDWGQTEDQDFDLGHADTSAPATEDTQVEQSALVDPDDGWGAVFDDDDFLPDSVAADAFNFGDDEGFLDDVAAGNAFLDQPISLPPTPAAVPTSRYAPAGVTAPAAVDRNPQRQASQYLPATTPFMNLSQPTQSTAPAGVPAHATPSAYSAAFGQVAARPTLTSSANSFADKARTGYASPYDLPDEIAKPRRRPALQQTAMPTQPVVQPPPRSTSSYGPPSAGLGGPTSQPVFGQPSVIPPVSAAGAPYTTGGPFNQNGPTGNRVERKNSADFFAELPAITPRPRAQTPMGKYAPQAAPSAQPQFGGPPRPPSANFAAPPPAQMRPPPTATAAQMRSTEAVPQFAGQPIENAMQLQRPTPPTISRYSPAPQQGNNVPEVRQIDNRPMPAALPATSPAPPPSRYSPAPPRSAPAPSAASSNYPSEISPPPSRSAAQPFAPRTSSPLAYSSRPFQPQSSIDQSIQEVAPISSHAYDQTTSMTSPSHDTAGLVHQANGFTQPYDQSVSASTGPPMPTPPTLSTSREATPPIPASVSVNSTATASPVKTSSYLPSAASKPSARSITDPGMAPPPRSYTSSPSTSVKMAPRLAAVPERSVSAYTGSAQPQSYIPSSAPGEKVIQAPMARQLTAPDANFVVPEDERAQDPLERWKGAPIIRWGSGGQVLTSFPTYVPRYGMAAMGPMIKCMQDDVKVRNVKDISPISQSLQKFPGPLKKGKKKDVVAWLKACVEELEKALPTMHLGGDVPTLDVRAEEKVLLWKTVSILIENDGLLEGNPAVDAAVRQLMAIPTPTEAPLSADPVTASTNTLSEAYDPKVLVTLRNYLTDGDREKAVWHAVDQRLWAHGLLIASTLSKDIWKQVVQEFVRKEIRKAGDNTESLAALYQVFAGNWEESIDELVSVSARAGFQMVTTEGSSSKDALSGLAKWRETLLLILNNRSAGDAQALLSLGKLLRNYGRIEAAHICMLFARSVVRISGADDPQADLTLLGEDPTNHGSDYGADLSSILLTEVLEYGFTLGSTPAPAMPHLQVYKLYHAEVLAESAQKSEAQSYCDAISSTVHGKTNKSPYFNLFLMQRLDDLGKRLSQSAMDNSSSWKPSMDKVSSSIFAKFNSFVAGDESKDAANGLAPPPPSDGENFVRMKGDTPEMSRQTSTADLYSAMNGSMPMPMPANANSKYAPGNAYSPRVSMEQQRSSSAYQPRMSQEMPRGTYDPTGRVGSPSQQRAASYNPAYAPQSSTSSSQGRSSFEGGRPPSNPMLNPPSGVYSGYSPNATQPVPAQSPYQSYSTSDPPQPTFPSQTGFGYQAPEQGSQDMPDQSEIPSYQSSYQPYDPSSEAGESELTPVASFEPPSYQPYEPEAESEAHAESPSDEKKPKKKSYMDDDDDDELFQRAAAIKKGGSGATKGKSDADRATDEAFRKAAEADAARDAAAGDKRGSWFGGWFKKGDPGAMPQQGPGPIKAKLGESNSFVFDPELNKWVNKKAGAVEAPTQSGTPPPPKSSTPRSVSAATPPPRPMSGMGPPPIPAHVNGGSLLAPGGRPMSVPPPLNRTESQNSIPGTSSPPSVASGPPSRPGSSLSRPTGGDALDEMMGPAMGRRGAAKKPARKGRYIDPMANAN